MYTDVELQAMLDRAGELQTEYWDAKSALEAALNVNLDNYDGELSGMTVEQLIEAIGEEN